MPVLSDAEDELLRLELSVEPRLGPKLGPRLGPNEFELASADTLNMPTQSEVQLTASRHAPFLVAAPPISRALR